jgi:hypothetical protein
VGTETRIVGRVRKRGRLLEISQDGTRLLDLRLGKDAKPARAIIDAPGAAWRLERVDKALTNVTDKSGAQVASIDYSERPQQIVIGSERIPFTSDGAFALRRYRLGDDLFVARATRWAPFQEFVADVSPALQARPDGILLLGLACAFTHWRVQDTGPTAADRTYYQ